MTLDEFNGVRVKNNLIQPTAKTDGTWLASRQQTKKLKLKKVPSWRSRLDYNVDAATWK